MWEKGSRFKSWCGGHNTAGLWTSTESFNVFWTLTWAWWGRQRYGSCSWPKRWRTDSPTARTPQQELSYKQTVMKPLKKKSFLCGSNAARSVFSLVPVELQHAAGDGHASWDLERHAADEVHAVSRVWVEGRVIQLLSVVELLLCGAGREGSCPAEHQNTHIEHTNKRFLSVSYQLQCPSSHLQLSTKALASSRRESGKSAVRQSVMLKKCFSRPINVVWSHRGASMSNELEAMLVCKQKISSPNLMH